LVVIGDGPLRSSLEAATRSACLNATFVGAKEPAAVQSWMQRAQVLAFPSIVTKTGAEEGFGLVLAEAQASGLPVVAFSTGGVPEAVQDGRTGLLVRSGDIRALSTGIAFLLEDEAARAEFSSKARRHAVSNFNLRRQNELLQDAYDRVTVRVPIAAAGAR
jgi:glycosyltransferase involved in cell wall biosynthesis